MRFRIWLLRLLPLGFRTRHAPAMNEVFESQLEAARRRGRVAVLRLWAKEFLDLIRAGVTLRWSERRANAFERRAVSQPRTSLGLWMSEVWRDLFLAARSLNRRPGFAAVAVLSLALGIGANLAVFSLLDRLVLTKLPVREPDQLYNVVVMQASGRLDANPYPKYEVMRDNFPDVFEDVLGWGGLDRDVTVEGRSSAETVVSVSANYFEALGVEPVLGRLLQPSDELEGVSDVAVISHRFWMAAFGGDPEVLGRTVEIDTAAYVVVGVLPPQFTGVQPGVSPPVFLNRPGAERLNPYFSAVGLRWFHIMGRLADGVPIEAAREAVRTRWGDLDEPNRTRAGRSTRDYLLLESGSSGFANARVEFSTALVVLMALVAAVFLIACANLATLLFVRAARRTREMVIRTAIGASRGRLVREWMAECLLLAALGGVAGLLVAGSVNDLLIRFVATNDQNWLRFELDPKTLWVGVALTVAAGFIAGLAPGLRATGSRPEPMLRANAHSMSERRGSLAQSVLALQLAASLVLVVGGALFARTLSNLNSTSGGFARRELVYADADFSDFGGDWVRMRGAMDAVMERLRRSPLVAAAVNGTAPMWGGNTAYGYVTDVSGYEIAPGDDNIVYHNYGDPGYFDAIGARLLAGRDFDERDRPAGPRDPDLSVIISEHTARHYFQGRSPLGQTIDRNRTRYEIIGVVEDLQMEDLREPQRDVIFFPLFWDQWRTLLVRVRAGVDPVAVELEVRNAFEAENLKPPLWMGRIETKVQESFARDRLIARLSAAFALLGILLAAMGLYAAIAHSVAGRTRELGIRVAMGATSRDVVGVVLKESLVVTAAGVAIGLPAALMGGQLIRSLLFGVSPVDPLVIGSATAVLVVTGIAAAWRPAHLASRLDPAVTLRSD